METMETKRGNGCDFFAYNWEFAAYGCASLLPIVWGSFFAYKWSLFIYNWILFAYKSGLCL